MLELIQTIIYNTTGKRGVTLDTDFVNDLELNSFEIMSLVCAFEDHFQTTIPTRDVWRLKQVRDVIDYMRSHGIGQP